MITERACNCYRHTIRAAYHSLGLTSDPSDSGLRLFCHSDVSSLSMERVVALCLERMKARLAGISTGLAEQVLQRPGIRTVHFNNREIHLPLLNEQAVEWYGRSSIFNFDFIVESFLGMHKDARTIYDIGGHHGVWAAYYSLICGPTGRVYTFEPSILNVECSALLLLINSVENVVNIPFGVGERSGVERMRQTGILVDFIDHDIGLLRFDHAFWEPADFIKIDIEGFEYELMRSFGRLFDFCQNVHLELHIPHLEKRGIDYREIYALIPFEKLRVFNYQHTHLREVGPSDRLEGFCSLLICPRAPGAGHGGSYE